MSRHFYAVVYPRSFANEYDVVAFDGIKFRDAFVAGYVGHSPNCRVYAVTRLGAISLLRGYPDSTVEDHGCGINCYLGGYCDRESVVACLLDLEEYTLYSPAPAGITMIPVRLA